MLPIGTRLLKVDSQGSARYFLYRDARLVLITVQCAVEWDPSYHRRDIQFVSCTNHGHHQIPAKLEGVFVAARVGEIWYLTTGYERGVLCEVHIDPRSGCMRRSAKRKTDYIILPSGYERFTSRFNIKPHSLRVADEFHALSLISGNISNSQSPVQPNARDGRIEMGAYPHLLGKRRRKRCKANHLNKTRVRGYPNTPKYLKPSSKDEKCFQRSARLMNASEKIDLPENRTPFHGCFGIPLLDTFSSSGRYMSFAMLSELGMKAFSSSLGSDTFPTPSAASNHASGYGNVASYRVYSFDGASASSYFLQSNAGHVVLFLSGVHTMQCHKQVSDEDINRFFQLAEVVAPCTRRKTTCHGGHQLFGPQHSSTMARPGPGAGPPCKVPTWYGSRIDFNQSKRCGTFLENVESSKLAERLGRAAAVGIAKECAFWFVKGHSSGRYGPCAIHIATWGYFFNSNHKDPDGHIKSYQQKMEEREKELDSILVEQKKLSKKERFYLERMRDGHKVAHSAPSTCTWIVKEEGEWELHAYFLFPASRIALRLSDRCALFWHPAELLHCTAVNVATNKATGETVYLGVAEGKAPVDIRAWGAGGPAKG